MGRGPRLQMSLPEGTKSRWRDGGKKKGGEAVGHCAGHCWPAGNPANPRALQWAVGGRGSQNLSEWQRGGTVGQYPLEHQAHTFMKPGEPYFEELSKNLFLHKIPYGGGGGGQENYLCFQVISPLKIIYRRSLKGQLPNTFKL